MPPELRLARLDHLVLTVRSIPATVEFYRHALGMEKITFGAGRTALRFGGQKINLHEVGHEVDPKAARPSLGSADLCFLSPAPLDAWITHLRAADVAIEQGPVKRTGAQGPIESIYLRDPDGNLLEIANQVAVDADPLAPLRAWLLTWQARVRAGDLAGGRELCAPELLAFGTRAEMVEGVDAVMNAQWRHVWPRIREFTVDAIGARGAVEGDRGWVATRWDSQVSRPDGSSFPRPGRLTILFERRDGRWLATHTHFSLTPGPGGERTS